MLGAHVGPIIVDDFHDTSRQFEIATLAADGSGFSGDNVSFS